MLHIFRPRNILTLQFPYTDSCYGGNFSSLRHMVLLTLTRWKVIPSAYKYRGTTIKSFSELGRRSVYSKGQMTTSLENKLVYQDVPLAYKTGQHLASSIPSTILIPNRTCLVRFGCISGEFGRAMVRPNELDMLLKRTKKRCD